ncbi:acyl-CoA dehydrogenase family protein [Jannaschia sp. Os4]|uniref:acyl-CoA dehydrogenase family protein n=1 Tax=Jannaschia sp. Os4 TaxID=2807617 RepID=UPI0019393334|nr:acyl-CoA dehydrogenase family protein [Jannaschia sp. Os4]MBM2577192.1 acyl-CoA dehydrogenase family protein [Jannaschia sp. Os4]
MPHDGAMPAFADAPLLADLRALTGPAVAAAEAHLAACRASVSALVRPDGGVDPALLDRHQTAAHALAWTATYVEALRQLDGWATRLEAEDAFGEVEALILQVAFGEYLWQLYGGLPMGQSEIVRPQDMGLSQEDQRALMAPEVMRLTQEGNTPAARARLARLIRDGATPATGLDDEMEMIRDQFARWAADKVTPHAHEWHLKDELIPMDVIDEMAELGVFGLTIPEEHGGLGLPKAAMCVVSEELSRAYIGVGSLGTRSEIAAELVLAGGTEAQKAKWLPRLASGETLPTAVFTEPNTGSDLGALKTRAVRDGGDWSVTGAKTWITHAARTHVMTVLARTEPGTEDWRGLSMFLAEKTPGTDAAPFPDEGLSGGEIEVLGYRGMKEYTLSFDGFRVDGDNLLGGETGQGFKQLMQTFESARIQTAARAVGVAQNALDLSLAYAEDRAAFGKPIAEFPRVADKIAMMAVEIAVARQITYFSAREKDEGRRCDLEAGMAKLLAARVAWSAADAALQIHGGNGFALEYPISRVLCDARILSIFEGAAEIQAQVIARRLLA